MIHSFQDLKLNNSIVTVSGGILRINSDVVAYSGQSVGDVQQTGISLKNSINLVSGNLITTGQNLGTKIDSLSGFVKNTALNVTGFGNQTGVINISGLGSITVFTGINNSILISGAASQGVGSNSDGINLSGNLTTTGQTLNIKINSLSGFLYNSGLSNLVYRTGDQNINGNKIFLDSIQVSGIITGKLIEIMANGADSLILSADGISSFPQPVVLAQGLTITEGDCVTQNGDFGVFGYYYTHEGGNDDGGGFWGGNLLLNNRLDSSSQPTQGGYIFRTFTTDNSVMITSTSGSLSNLYSTIEMTTGSINFSGVSKSYSLIMPFGGISGYATSGNLTTLSGYIGSNPSGYLIGQSGQQPNSGLLNVPISIDVFGDPTKLLGGPSGWVNLQVSGKRLIIPYYLVS